jgi:hypothetical protein
LARAAPVLTHLDDSSAILPLLEEALQLPVGLLSTGAGAADKVWRNSKTP